MNKKELETTTRVLCLGLKQQLTQLVVLNAQYYNEKLASEEYKLNEKQYKLLMHIAKHPAKFVNMLMTLLAFAMASKEARDIVKEYAKEIHIEVEN